MTTVTMLQGDEPVCSARTSLLIVLGPGEPPEGTRTVTRRHADRLAVDLDWVEVADGIAAAELVAGAGAGGHDGVVLASGGLVAAPELAAAVRAADLPTVHVGAEALGERPAVPAACAQVIHGRGRRSFRGGVDWVVAELAHPSTTLAYGAGADHVGDLRVPQADAGPVSGSRPPVVVLLHGGFWLDPWERDLMGRLASALAGQGWATWNVEYRRRGPSGGGWPTTFEDACAAVDAVADLAVDHAVDSDRVVVLGHSAGAQLALYATLRERAGDDAPGRVPRITPVGVVSLAGLLDLEAAEADGLADGAVTGFLGSPQEHPERYAVASPVRRVPTGVPILAVHGPGDRLVPVAQSTSFATAAREAGDAVELLLVDVPHLDIVDPEGPAMDPVVTWLDRIVRPPSRHV